MLAGLARPILPALLLVYLAAPGALLAQEEKLPKAETILDKYIEVTGGKAAYEKLNNRVTKATVEMVGQGIKFAVTTYGAKPAKAYNLMESEAFGKIERGTDGEVVWEINVMTGPQIKEGEERAFFLREAVFNASLKWRKLYKKVECVGLETVDEKPCYKVVLTPAEGSPETSYYGKESGLLVKVEASLTTPMGKIPFESHVSDYKEVDGVMFPYKVRVIVMGSERVVTTESIEHNVKIPADRFDLPAEIQALLEREKSEKAGAEETP
jgi:hypothetical protein